MATDAIQIRGVDAVLDHYKKGNIAAWASCKGKAMNCKYEGSDIEEGGEILKEWLERLKQFNSAASYELRLYEDLPKNGKIRPSTADYISFMFCVKEREDAVTGTGQLPPAGITTMLREIYDGKFENYMLQTKLDQLQQQLDELEEEVEQYEKKPKNEPQKGMGHVLLEAYAPKLIEIGNRIADGLTDAILPSKANALAGIILENGPDDQDKAIFDAIARLKKSVPDKPGLAAILTSLANFSEKNKFLFTTYTGQLTRSY